MADRNRQSQQDREQNRNREQQKQQKDETRRAQPGRTQDQPGSTRQGTDQTTGEEGNLGERSTRQGRQTTGRQGRNQ